MNKNKHLYYFLNLTWGIEMTLIGGAVAIVLLALGKKPKRYHGAIYFEVGKGWGGIDLGLFFLCSEDSGERVKSHEFGHSLQNCLYGPLMFVLVCIPSATRYWYRELKYNRRGRIPPTKYDDAWFEGQATKWGQKYKDLFY